MAQIYKISYKLSWEVLWIPTDVFIVMLKKYFSTTVHRIQKICVFVKQTLKPWARGMQKFLKMPETLSHELCF